MKDKMLEQGDISIILKGDIDTLKGQGVEFAFKIHTDEGAESFNAAFILASEEDESLKNFLVRVTMIEVEKLADGSRLNIDYPEKVDDREKLNIFISFMLMRAINTINHEKVH